MRAPIVMFMVIMLITGAANTLLMKQQTRQVVPDGPGHTAVPFDHAFFQTLLMMLGEFFCLGAYFASRTSEEAERARTTGFPKFAFIVPVLCDMTATTLVNAAFLLIPASTVQMTRGAIVLFTCAFSVIFLGRRQYIHHYIGVALVALGITLVSLCAVLTQSTGDVATSAMQSKPLLGISLCVFAQMFQAAMLVIEERILSSYHVAPLQAVGMEGLYGLVLGVPIVALLSVLHYENVPAAFYQMGQSVPLAASVTASIGTIAVFNWSGITVTANASAVARSTVDCSRTILVWMVELWLLWNTFHWLQLAGFVVLALGTLLYNQIVPLPAFLAKQAAEQEEQDKLQDKLQAKEGLPLKQAVLEQEHLRAAV